MSGDKDTRQEYVLVVGGIEHTVLVEPDDAERRGLTPVAKAVSRPANKAVSHPRNKGV